jgi:hypothetical protein
LLPDIYDGISEKLPKITNVSGEGAAVLTTINKTQSALPHVDICNSPFPLNLCEDMNIA